MTWKTIREIGICRKNSNPTSAINLNVLNENFVNIPVINSNYSINYTNTRF